MGLYDEWKALTDGLNNEGEIKSFWDGYFAKETEAYKKILSDKDAKVEWTVKELAERFDMPETHIIGFIDGINTSLKQEIELEPLESDSVVKLDVDFEKLYFNMHEAKAPWLYGLAEWDGVLSEERRKEITHEWRLSKQFINDGPKIGPNDPCPCGSGKKYKKCCGRKKD